MTKRRQQKYVDREVQTGLILRLSIHWLLFMAANVIVISLWTKLVDTPTEPWAETVAIIWQRVFPFMLVSFALAPVFIWDAIKLSNRFTGPIVRVRRALALIADGEPPKAIEFRTGDFWKSLANDFNRAFVNKPASDTDLVTKKD